MDFKSSVRHVLTVVKKEWLSSENAKANEAAKLLQLAAMADKNKEVWHLLDSHGCQPPPDFETTEANKSQDLHLAISQGWTFFNWIIANEFQSTEETTTKNNMIVARLVGPKGFLFSDLIDVKIICVGPNTVVPIHSEESSELLQILEGEGCQIGFAVGDWIDQQTINYFPATQTKVLKTGANRVIALSVHYGGKLDEEICFHQSAVFHKYAKLPQHATDPNGDITEKFYNDFAGDYSEVVRAWGYCMPQLISDALVNHGKLKPSHDVKIIDLGCGDGLGGVALHKIGFTNLIGVDVSEEMLKIAERRGIYHSTTKFDLMKKLPFDDATFDCAIIVGVTSYLDTSVLPFWLSIVKKGGLICFTHKATVWPSWEGEQVRLEESGEWKLVWSTIEPVPYLPNLAVHLNEKGQSKEQTGQNRAKIYIYEKI